MIIKDLLPVSISISNIFTMSTLYYQSAEEVEASFGEIESLKATLVENQQMVKEKQAEGTGERIMGPLFEEALKTKEGKEALRASQEQRNVELGRMLAVNKELMAELEKKQLVHRSALQYYQRRMANEADIAAKMDAIRKFKNVKTENSPRNSGENSGNFGEKLYNASYEAEVTLERAVQELSMEDRKAKVPTKLPVYGTRGGHDKSEVIEDPMEFLAKWESVMIADAFPITRYAMAIPSCMKSAKLIEKMTEMVKEYDGEWSRVRQGFLESQMSVQYTFLKNQELQTVGIVKGETVRQFNERFEQLVGIVKPRDSGNTVSLYERGLSTRRGLWNQMKATTRGLRSTGVELTLKQLTQLALSVEADMECETGGLTADRSETKNGVNQGSKGTCRKCGKKGHWAKECRSSGSSGEQPTVRKVETVKQSGAKVPKAEYVQGVTCYKCQEKGHYAKECTNEYKPRVAVVSSWTEEICEEVSSAEESSDSEAWLVEIDDGKEQETVRRVKDITAETVERTQEKSKKVSRHEYVTPCVVGGVSMFGLVDSGASISLIARKVCEEHGFKIMDRKGMMRGAFSGSEVRRIGFTCQPFQNGSFSKEVELEVSELDGVQLIIGTDLFGGLGIQLKGVVVKWPEQQCREEEPVLDTEEEEALKAHRGDIDEITEAERARVAREWGPLLTENEEFEETEYCTYPGAVLTVNTGEHAPVFVPQYAVPRHLEDKVSERVSEWVTKGWVEAAPKGNPWSFPLMAAAKKDAEGGMTAMRLCVDLRRLNALVKNENYPIPRMGELLMKHDGQRYFASFDQADGYHQWKLADRDIGKIAFTWKGRQYQFVRACFGIKTMTSLFQRVMNELLHDIEGVDAYVDDIILGCADFEGFIESGKEVLRRLNKYRIRLRRKKCILVASSLVHLGRQMSRIGFSPDPNKIKEIVEWMEPTTYGDLHSFVCLAGYYREHIPRFAEVAGPMMAAQRKTGKIVWDKKLRESYEEVKRMFTELDLILRYPDYGKPFDLFVDASLVGMGAVLMQEHEGKLRLVSAASKAFRGSTLNYSATKKELLAVVWALRRFGNVLRGTQFTLHTDHRALMFLLTQTHINPMLARWVETILELDFDIQHVPGAENVIADALSRQYEKWRIDRHGQTIKKEAKARLLRVVQEDWVSISRVTTAKDDERHMAEFYGKKILPQKQREKAMERVHSFGHYGQQAMFAKLWHEGVWWQSMRADLADLMSRCDPCQRFNVVRQGYHPPSVVSADEPMGMAAIDLSLSAPKSSDGYACLVCYVDIFTGMVILRPARSKSMEEIAGVLWRIWADFGVPKVLISDNGSEFLNSVMECLRQTFFVRHRLVVAYSHQANGAVERAIRTVSIMLKKILMGATTEWPRALPIVQMSVNMMASTRTGTPPFTLMFGRVMGLVREDNGEVLSEPSDSAREEFVARQKWLVSKLYPAIAEREALKKEKSRTRQMRVRKQITDRLKVGAVVFARDVSKELKWDSMYEGPYTVVGHDAAGAYVLRDPDGEIVGRHFSVDQLKITRRENVLDHENQGTYRVEKIMDDCNTGLGQEYLVQWKGYGQEDDTWEPEANFNDWKVIVKYWAAKRQLTSFAGRGLLESVAKGGRESSQKGKMGVLKEKELGEGLMEAGKRDRNAKRM